MMSVLSSQNSISLPTPTSKPTPKDPSSTTTSIPTTATTHKWVEVPQQAIEASSQLLCEAEYSDVALTYGGDLFRAHRAVICPRSPIFKAECNGSFTEADSRRIAIGAPSATLGAIARMLAWLYMHDYPDRSSVRRQTNHKGKQAVAFTHPKAEGDDKPPHKDVTEQVIRLESSSMTSDESTPAGEQEYFDPSSFPLRHLHVYGLADYYQIQDLKHAAQTKFNKSLEEVTDAQELKEVIAQVYEYTFSNDILRRIVTQHASSLRHRLNSDSGFLSSVSVIPDFMRDYLVENTQCYENEIAEQTENMMRDRDRVEKQLTQEKGKTTSLKLSVTNSQTIIASMNKRISSLASICNRINEKQTCSNCQTAHPLQVVKPKVKRPSSPRTDEEAWYLACSNCSRRASKVGEMNRAVTASPSSPLNAP